MAYATADQLAAILPGIVSADRTEDLNRVLDMAALEIEKELDLVLPPLDFSDYSGSEQALITHVNLERAADLWHMEQIPSGLLLGGETPLLAPRNSWERYANMLAPLKEQWGFA